MNNPDNPPAAPEAPVTAVQPVDGPEVSPDAVSASEGVSEPGTDDASDPSGKGKAARDAAKYRTQLRETETKLAESTARLESMQLELAREVAVRAGLASGEEFNVPAAEFTDPDTGLVDAATVARLTLDLIESKPYLRRRTSWDDGQPVSESQLEAMAGKSWSDFLRK